MCIFLDFKAWDKKIQKWESDLNMLKNNNGSDEQLDLFRNHRCPYYLDLQIRKRNIDILFPC